MGAPATNPFIRSPGVILSFFLKSGITNVALLFSGSATECDRHRHCPVGCRLLKRTEVIGMRQRTGKMGLMVSSLHPDKEPDNSNTFVQLVFYFFRVFFALLIKFAKYLFIVIDTLLPSVVRRLIIFTTSSPVFVSTNLISTCAALGPNPSSYC